MATDIENFILLLKMSVGTASSMGKQLSETEWQSLFEMSCRQNLVGILFHGIENLPSEERPDNDILMTWYSQVVLIKKANQKMNQRAINALGRFRMDGYRACLLKGQGLSQLYPCPDYRQSGDIDVWVDGSAKSLIRYAHMFSPHSKALYHNVEMSMKDGTLMDIHYRPSYLYNPIYNKRVSSYFDAEKTRQFSHAVEMRDGSGKITVPTTDFNMIYLLCHINQHLFNEGIGFKQIIDYYYVLKNLEKSDMTSVVSNIRRFGLSKLAGSVLYVLDRVIGLEDDQKIMPLDFKRGEYLLNEIFQTGHFGQYDSRYSGKSNMIAHNWRRLSHNFRFLRLFPSEVLSELPFRIYQWVWRQMMKRY